MRRAIALRAVLAGVLIVSLAGCKAANDRPDYDPIEGLNRPFFRFNDGIDVYVLAPISTGWDRVFPDPAQRGIARFFTNLLFPVRFVNNVLQLKLGGAATETGRFVVNTTVGILGFRDPATGWGLAARPEDFGQTLGHYGVRPGAYLNVPLLGPSNPRDLVGRVADFFLSFGLFPAAFVVDRVNARSLVLEEVREAKRAALDYYVFVRNAYFQRRRVLVSDGTEVPAPVAEDLYDEDDIYFDDEPDVEP